MYDRVLVVVLVVGVCAWIYVFRGVPAPGSILSPCISGDRRASVQCHWHYASGCSMNE